jgi:glycerol-3-phosphate acyltransferase PlsY
MSLLLYLFVLLAAYLLGAIPTGLIIVKIVTGKDVRQIESGRTGGTNVMRAAGFWAGLSTGIIDVIKGIMAVVLAYAITPGNLWVQVLAPWLAIVGQVYSIFLLDRTEDGKLRLRGGAGGATCLGGLIALWWPSVLFVLPIGMFIWLGIGYASVATLSMGFFAIVIFVYRAIFYGTSWVYIVYGVLAELVLIWTLRPNIQRLFRGTERIVGIRAKKKANGSEEKVNILSVSSHS